MKKSIQHAFAAAALLGVCGAAVPAHAAEVVIVDFQRVYAESTAGKDAQAKLKAIADGVTRELDPEAKALKAESDSTWAPKFKDKTGDQVNAELNKDAALKAKYVTYAQRENAFAQKQQVRRAELEATQQQTIQAVLNAAEPDVRAAMTAKGAVVVLEKNNVAISSPAADVTVDVLTRFNNRVKTIDVKKVDLTQPQK
jgi:Skp family chaperone for outer membrane proteins